MRKLSIEQWNNLLVIIFNNILDNKITLTTFLIVSDILMIVLYSDDRVIIGRFYLLKILLKRGIFS